MKTYIDLEMWELAYDKAEQVLRNFPESPEAEKLSKNINELRWKAEPKFLDHTKEEKGKDENEMVEAGLQQTVEHVKTYMELGMWELARQKALALMKNFPDTPQSDEIGRIYPEIEKRYKERDPSAIAPAVDGNGNGNEPAPAESKEETP